MPNLKKFEVIQKRFDQFCHLSSLHGLPYLRSDNSLPITERVFWMSVFVLNLILSSYIMSSAWSQWVHTPFMIVYDSDLSFIWEIPFPTVIVCSSTAVKRTVLDLAVTNDTVKLYYSNLLCRNKDFFNTTRLSITQDQMESFYEFLIKASPACEELLRKCSWHGEDFSCCQKFSPVITNSGLCYLFNSLPSRLLYAEDTKDQFMFKDSYPDGSQFWSPMAGYPDRGYRTFPRWGSQAGHQYGLSIELRQDKDDWQEPCDGGYQGFKLCLSDVHKVYDPISETNLNIKKELKHNGQGNSSVRICSNVAEHRCIDQVSEGLVFGQVTKTDNDDSQGPLGCSCYPDCNEVTYDYTTNRNLFIYENASGVYDVSETNEAFSKVSIFYNNLKFLGVRRQAETSFYDFLGNCGGLLSLMTGFSFVTVLEIFYHLLIRPSCCLLLNAVKSNKATVAPRPPLRIKKHLIKDRYFH